MLRLAIVTFFYFSNSYGSSLCESTFEEFLDKFQLDQEYQISRILYPLHYSHLDMGPPEPKPVLTMLSKQDVLDRKFSIYPNQQRFKKDNLQKEINQLKEAKFQVVLRKPDTGVRLVYYFEIKKDCWQLVKFDNEST